MTWDATKAATLRGIADGNCASCGKRTATDTDLDRDMGPDEADALCWSGLNGDCCDGELGADLTMLRDLILAALAEIERVNELLRWSARFPVNCAQIPRPRWACIMDAMSAGSTSAKAHCHAFGFDPDEMIGPSLCCDETDEDDVAEIERLGGGR